MSAQSEFSWREAAWVVSSGGLIAYPTESVYGIGCDPGNENALLDLLAIKRRDWRKGVILVAASMAQLEPWLAPLDETIQAKLDATWPGPTTWLLPAAAGVSPLVRGEHDSIAVRVSAHPVVQGICKALGGPMVSTSANVSGRRPMTSSTRVRLAFGNKIDFVVSGKLGGLDRPTEIRDGISNQCIRS